MGKDGADQQMIDNLSRTLSDKSDAGLARLVDIHRALGPDGNRDQALGEEIRNAWKVVLGSKDQAEPALEAIRRSGALVGPVDPRVRILVEDFISALARGHHKPAYPTLKELWENDKIMPELRERAGLNLRDLNEPWSLECLTAKIEKTRGLEFKIAFQALLMTDPNQAWDWAQSNIASPSLQAGERLEAIVHVLFDDIRNDGQAHWGASRGWFDADPRWLGLCETWKKLPPPDVRALWGKENVQSIFEICAWLRKRAGK